jgi:fumarate reductase flavoprotein subunit
MVKRCADCGFDLAGGQVEVVPTAHYLMGGVVVKPDTRSDLPGLFVAGEDAGGAHGANRLGGNGVANSTVFGGIAGEEMAGFVATQVALCDFDGGLVAAAIEECMAPLRRPRTDINAIRGRLLDVMWDDVGVLRDAQGIARAQTELAALKAELLESGIGDDNRVFALGWHDWLNLRSLVEVSEVIAAAALSRENSRGAHYREDFPEVGSLEESYFTIASRARDELKVERAAVEFSIVKPGESLI